MNNTFKFSKLILGRSISLLNSVCQARKVCLFQSNFFSGLSSSTRNSPAGGLTLKPFNPLMITSCGLKVRGRLQLRCKNCYFERKDGVLYVSCTSYPRHKQRALTKCPKASWILTSCCQSKFRPY